MKILGFTGNRAELFIQSSLFISLSKNPKFEFSLLSYDNQKDDIYTSQLEDLKNNGVHLLDSITSDRDQQNHIGTVTFIVNEINRNLKQEYDLAIVYADRYESFAFALALFHKKIPILHVEAGDITQGGTMDDSIRHAISRISSLFATSTLNAKKFLSDSHEEGWRIIHNGLLSYSDLTVKSNTARLVGNNASWMNRFLSKPLIICTMHSVPQLEDQGLSDAINCYKAIDKLSDKYIEVGFIITSPNPDEGSIPISAKLRELSEKENLIVERSLGKNYYFLLNTAKSRKVALVGNSSSIIKEAPFFNCYHINVGARQNGRVAASSQVDIEAETDEIFASVESVLKSKRTQPILEYNPYWVNNDPVDYLCQWLEVILEDKTRDELLVKHWG